MKRIYLLLIGIALTSGLYRLSAQQAVLPADSLALVDFYLASGGDWDNTNTWLKDSVSKWAGVTMTGNRVTELTTEGFNLTGTVSPSLGKLSALKVLKLLGQETGPVIIDLHGTIPPEIWNLTNLEKLQIKFTSITGGIPAGIESMTSLQEINFQQTKLGGSIPAELFELPSLIKAYLHESDFTGTVPSTVTGARQLTRLYLQDNKLEGPLPFADSILNGKVQLTGNFFSFADVKPYHDAFTDGHYTAFTDDYQYAQDDQHFTLDQRDSVAFEFYVKDADSYAWFYNDGATPVSTDTLYYISSVVPTDTGTYVCKVQNSTVPNFDIRATFIIDTVTKKVSALDENTVTDLIVYPNPFSDYININGSSELKSVKILDITGKPVYIEDNLSGTSFSMSLQDLKKGIYFISIENNNSTSVQKITKK